MRDLVKAFYDKKSGPIDRQYTTKAAQPEVLAISKKDPVAAARAAGAVRPDA